MVMGIDIFLLINRDLYKVLAYYLFDLYKFILW